MNRLSAPALAPNVPNTLFASTSTRSEGLDTVTDTVAPKNCCTADGFGPPPVALVPTTTPEGPWGPGSPSGPWRPVSPFGPWAPGSPFAPAGPAAPLGPGGPRRQLARAEVARHEGSVAHVPAGKRTVADVAAGDRVVLDLVAGNQARSGPNPGLRDGAAAEHHEQADRRHDVGERDAAPQRRDSIGLSRSHGISTSLTGVAVVRSAT